jgi:hypothetical protein
MDDEDVKKLVANPNSKSITRSVLAIKLPSKLLSS